LTASSAAISVRHRLEYATVVGVRRVVAALPWRVAMAAGAGLGLAFHALDRPHRRLTVANIAAAFPRRTPRQHALLARAVFVHFGQLLVELLRFSRLRPERLRSLVEFEGEEHVEQAHLQGKGALFVTGHFGFWELHALAHGLALYPIAVVARALDNPLLHGLLERVRTSTGNTVLYRHRGLRGIMRALASNQGVAILIDQHVQTSDAVVVDFFDRPAATTSAVAAIALRTGAPVIPAFAVPLDGGRYRLIYEHPVEPPPADSPDAVREFTQRCTDVLEMYVRRYPELWLWMHRRWRDVREPSGPGMFPPVGKEEVDADS
jgi:KDO2-lipid IV(A) lauroyltransferase